MKDFLSSDRCRNGFSKKSFHETAAMALMDDDKVLDNDRETCRKRQNSYVQHIYVHGNEYTGAVYKLYDSFHLQHSAKYLNSEFQITLQQNPY